jgi:hypothetical protein
MLGRAGGVPRPGICTDVGTSAALDRIIGAYASKPRDGRSDDEAAAVLESTQERLFSGRRSRSGGDSPDSRRRPRTQTVPMARTDAVYDPSEL